MFASLTSGLDFHSRALVLRAERQRTIASNIANADTPGYVARDLDFKAAMANATAGNSIGSGSNTTAPNGVTHAGHIPLPGGGASGLAGSSKLAYAAQTQPSMDGNSVDLDRERANFVDNSVRYETTLRFINGQSKTILLTAPASTLRTTPP